VDAESYFVPSVWAAKGTSEGCVEHAPQRYAQVSNHHEKPRLADRLCARRLLVQDTLGLELVRFPGKRHFCFMDEEPLTDWLCRNTRVAFAVSEHPSQTEAAWLQIEPGLLNIKGCPPTFLTTELKKMRRLASGLHLPRPQA
jgi:hypothetical protein